MLVCIASCGKYYYHHHGWPPGAPETPYLLILTHKEVRKNHVTVLAGVYSKGSRCLVPLPLDLCYCSFLSCICDVSYCVTLPSIKEITKTIAFLGYLCSTGGLCPTLANGGAEPSVGPRSPQAVPVMPLPDLEPLYPPHLWDLGDGPKAPSDSFLAPSGGKSCLSIAALGHYEVMKHSRSLPFNLKPEISSKSLSQKWCLRTLLQDQQNDCFKGL